MSKLLNEELLNFQGNQNRRKRYNMNAGLSAGPDQQGNEEQKPTDKGGQALLRIFEAMKRNNHPQYPFRTDCFKVVSFLDPTSNVRTWWKDKAEIVFKTSNPDVEIPVAEYFDYSYPGSGTSWKLTGSSDPRFNWWEVRFAEAVYYPSSRNALSPLANQGKDARDLDEWGDRQSYNNGEFIIPIYENCSASDPIGTKSNSFRLCLRTDYDDKPARSTAEIEAEIAKGIQLREYELQFNSLAAGWHLTADDILALVESRPDSVGPYAGRSPVVAVALEKFVLADCSSDPCENVPRPTDEQLYCYCDEDPEEYDCNLVTGTIEGSHVSDKPSTSLPPFIEVTTQGDSTIYRFNVEKFKNGNGTGSPIINGQYNQAYYNKKFNTWIIKYEETNPASLLKLGNSSILRHRLDLKSPLSIDASTNYDGHIVYIALKQDTSVTSDNEGWYIDLLCNAKKPEDPINEVDCKKAMEVWMFPSAAVADGVGRDYIVRADTGTQQDIKTWEWQHENKDEINELYRRDCYTLGLLQKNIDTKKAGQVTNPLYWIATGEIDYLGETVYLPMRWMEQGYWLCLDPAVEQLPELIKEEERIVGNQKEIIQTYETVYAFWILDSEKMPAKVSGQHTLFVNYLGDAIIERCIFPCTETKTIIEPLPDPCKDEFELCCKHIGMYDESNPDKKYMVKALDPVANNAIGTEGNPFDNKIYFKPAPYTEQKCKYEFSCPQETITPHVHHDQIIEGENPYNVSTDWNWNTPLPAMQQNTPSDLYSMIQNIGDDKIKIRDNNIDMLSTVFQYKPIHNFANWLNSANLNDNNWEALTKKLGDVFVSIWQNGVSQTTLITLIGKVFGANLASQTSVNLTPTEFVLLLELYKAIKDEIVLTNYEADDLNTKIQGVLALLNSPIKTLDEIEITLVSIDGKSSKTFTLLQLLYITPDTFKKALKDLGYGAFLDDRMGCRTCGRLSDPAYTYRRRRYLGDPPPFRTVQAGEAQLDAYFVQYGEEEPFWLIYDPLLNKYYTWEEGTCNLIPCECPREPEPDPDIQPCTCIWLLSLIDKVVDRIVALENAIKAANLNIIIPALDAELANLKQTIKNMPESEKNRPI